MNFYMGGFFMVIGALLLYKVHKRRGMISMDLGPEAQSKKNDSLSEAKDNDEEASGLL